jgi:hypothetical protein
LAYFAINNIGTTKVDSLETAIKDDSYVPAAVIATEVTNDFAAVKSGKNATAEIVFSPADENGNVVDISAYTADQLGANGFNAMFQSTYPISSKVTMTEDGLLATLTEKDTAGVASENKLAYFNRDGAGYGYSSTDGKTEALSGISDVLADSRINVWTPIAVTEAAVNSTDWLKRTEDETAGTVSFTGSVGDNTGSDVTNTLFAQLFDQFGWFTIGGSRIGSYLAAPVDFSSGKHALTLYSEYSDVTVNATTKDLSITALIYLPFSDIDDNYVLATYTISNVGTTVNDFSSYVVA